MIAAACIVLGSACGTSRSESTSAQRTVRRHAADQLPGGSKTQQTLAAIRGASVDTSTWLDSELLDLATVACDVLRRRNGEVGALLWLRPKNEAVSQADYDVGHAAQIAGIDHLCPQYKAALDAYLSR